MSIDAPPPDPAVDPTADPAEVVALRLVTRHTDAPGGPERSRRVDVAIGGTTSILLEDGVSTPFETRRLWPVLRDLLPPLDVVRAAPRGRPRPERRAPAATFATDVRAFVALTTVVAGPEGDVTTLRSWLATADALWSVTPTGGGAQDLRPEADGALADLLVWDVTAALETLARRLGAAS